MNKLPRHIWARVTGTLQRLRDDPRPRGTAKVQSEPAYRVRVGDCRVIYRINDEERLVDVKSVLHRKDAYR